MSVHFNFFIVLLRTLSACIHFPNLDLASFSLSLLSFFLSPLFLPSLSSPPHSRHSIQIAELESRRATDRAAESRQLVIAALAAEEAAAEHADDDENAAMPDDADDLEDEAAIEAWKVRAGISSKVSFKILL